MGLGILMRMDIHCLISEYRLRSWVELQSTAGPNRHHHHRLVPQACALLCLCSSLMEDQWWMATEG